MSYSNILHLVIGALAVTCATLGYLLYEARKEKGFQLNIDQRGISIDKR